MKKIGCFIFMNVVILSLMAQSNIRLNDFWDKTYFINPASINDVGLAEFNMAARKQWVGFPGSPTTLFATATTYLDNMHTQFGLKVMQDKIGLTNTSDIDFTYAYSLQLQNNWKMNMGVGVSYQMLSYDESELVLPADDDPAIYNKLLKENNFNANLGMELTNKFWKFGASSQNLFSLLASSNKQFVNTNFIYGMYHDYSHDYVNLGYGACAIQYGSLYQMEFNLTGYFKMTTESEAFQLGCFYRTWNEIGVIFGINLTKQIHLSYSYDYNTGGISRSSVGTQELTLTYNLPREWRCKNCWY